jgi:hypothetical protein
MRKRLRAALQKQPGPRRAAALLMICPRCNAFPGERCRGVRGLRASVHIDRLKASQKDERP